MEILVRAVDFIVLLFFVVHIPRAVWRTQPRGLGSLLLSICTALAVLTVATISFTVLSALAASASLLVQGIVLVLFLGMAALLRVSWRSNPAK